MIKILFICHGNICRSHLHITDDDLLEGCQALLDRLPSEKNNET